MCDHVLFESHFDFAQGSFDVAADVGIGPDGTAYVVGTGASSLWLFAVGVSGDMLWSKSIPDAEGAGLAVGRDGSITVVGQGRGLDGRVLISRYTSAGDPEWSREFVVPDAEVTVGGVALDENGGAWVVGSEFSASQDGLILQYAPDGNLTNEQRVQGAYGWTVLRAVILFQGDLVFTGWDANTMSDFDVFAQRRTRSGDIVWTHRYDSGGGHDQGRDVVATSDGNLVLVGLHQPDPDDPADGWVRKLSSTGETHWTRSYVGAFGRLDSANGAAPFGDGAVVVHGERRNDDPSLPESDGHDMWLQALDRDGTVLWSDIYSGDGEGGLRSWDFGVQVARVSEDFAIAIGTSYTTRNYDILVRSVCL